MKETLIVTGVIVFGIALRSTKSKGLRRFGMFCYIVATGLIGYFIFSSYLGAIAGVAAWLLFPWLELLLCVRKAKLPLNNKLERQCLPCDSYFPESKEMQQHLLDRGFRHLSDCCWQWDKSKEHYTFYWSDEKRHVVAICHRIQSCVTFCYLNVSSISEDGTIWRSTNFPFSSSLPPAPSTKFNHITDGKISCPEHVIYAHELFLYEQGVDLCQLSEEYAKQIEHSIEAEMRQQIDHNLERGIIVLTGDKQFRYSFKGLFFLWKQILKDMFRLC